MEQNQQGLAQSHKEYRWYNSYSLPLDVQVGVSRLELPLDISANSSEVPKDIYITAHIVCNQMPMHESPVSTFFPMVDTNRNALLWDYVMSFPLKIRDLSADALLVLTAWTPDGHVFGGTTMNFFDENGCMKRGKQKLMFYFGTVGDPNAIRHLNTTSGENYNIYSKYDYRFKLEKDLEIFMSNQSFGKNRNETKCEWLDRLTFAQIQSNLDNRNNNNIISSSNMNNDEIKRDLRTWGRSIEELEMESFCYLILDLPLLQYPVLHEEKQYQPVTPHIPPNSQMEMLSSLIADETDAVVEFTLTGRPFNASFLTIVADWDMDQDNLAEEQNRRLTQHSRRGAADATAKPNKNERERIDKVLTAVSCHLSTEDIDLLYRYRFSLTENKRALVKFLYTVNWDDETEVAEIPTLLALWTKKAPIDVADALKLLSKDKVFEHPMVREYAVSILRSASDDELLTFLLQLVQALRYEPSPTISAQPVAATTPAVVPVVDFAMENSIIGVNHLNINTNTTTASTVNPTVSENNTSILSDSIVSNSNSVLHGPSVVRSAGSLSPLANFLIDRACNSPIVANYFYWYLKVETEDETAGLLFQTVFDNYVVQLSTSGQEGKMIFKRLCALDDYIAKISGCQRDAREQRGRKEAKEQALIKLLEERQLHTIPRGVDWVPMPLDPSIQLMGLIPSTASMFASAVYPCVIEFVDYTEHAASLTATTPTTTTPTTGNTTKNPSSTTAAKPKTHKIMFKSGDDLRQDQLIMQMIALMDRLLKKVNLDLKLLTYGILAVGQKDGIMEFCRNSMPISAVLKNFNNSIADYLRHHNPDKHAPYEIAPLALDTFIKSCAGYCVVTYILGVGDRHLDNIMINTSGQMFHIDFGFIFGQDPKPMPPPFRFIRAMADAMGGEDAEHYARFKTFCCQSYNWLRKSATLILNLLSLMGDAGIQDISKRSDLPKVLVKVEEKFRLDLTDEQAEQFFLGLINESLHSLAPRLMEIAHKVAVSMR